MYKRITKGEIIMRQHITISLNEEQESRRQELLKLIYKSNADIFMVGVKAIAQEFLTQNNNS